MCGLIKLSKKNHFALDNHFKKSLSIVHQQNISKGKKYKDIINESNIIYSLFKVHTSKKCMCKNELICLFKKYEDNEISIDEVFNLMN